MVIMITLVIIMMMMMMMMMIGERALLYLTMYSMCGTLNYRKPSRPLYSDVPMAAILLDRWGLPPLLRSLFCE